MADLPMAQIPNFSLGGTQIPLPNNGPAYANALVGGANVALGQQQNQIAQQQANQQAQVQQAQIAAQQQQLQQQKGNDLVKNAIAAYDAYGDAAGPESFGAFKQGMNLMAPGSVDPNAQWDPSMGAVIKTAGDAFDAAEQGKRPWPEAIGVISKAAASASQQQRSRLMPLLQAAQDQFNQQQSTTRQQSSQTQDTQRAYAEHAQPLIQAGSTLNSISQALAANDPTHDAIAKANIEKLVANGTISQDDVEKLTSAGGPLEKLGESWNTWTTGKTFDDTHRKAMQAWIPNKINELNNTLQGTATAFPGATPAQIPQVISRTLKSGKVAVSYDGGKTWQPQ